MHNLAVQFKLPSPDPSIERLNFREPLFPNPNRTQVKRAEPPHEGELHHVSVHEEELHSAAALTTCDGLNRSVSGCIVGRQQHVLQRPEL